MVFILVQSDKISLIWSHECFHCYRLSFGISFLPDAYLAWFFDFYASKLSFTEVIKEYFLFSILGTKQENQLVNLASQFALNCFPQYCTAHPVLRIITRNKISWRLSLLESSYARKMGVSKGMVGKKRWKFVAKKEKTAERKFWNRWKCKNILSFSNMAEYSQSRGNLNRCDDLFFLNENGDLYFLLYKNIVHIILLNLAKN